MIPYLPLACSVRSVETNSIGFCNKLGNQTTNAILPLAFTYMIFVNQRFVTKVGYIHIKTKESTGIRVNGSDFWIVSLWIGTNMEANARFIYLLFCLCRLIAFFSFIQIGVNVTFLKLRRVFYMIRKKVVWNQLFSLWWMEDTGLIQKIPWVLWASSVSCFSPRNHQKNHLCNDKDYKFEH